MVRELGDALVTFGDHSQHATAPRLHLFEVGDDLLVNAVAGGDEHDRHHLVNQRDGTMLHLRGWISLRMDVSDFLELQRPFERDRKVATATEIERVLGPHERLGKRLDLVGPVQHGGDLIRQFGEGTHDLTSLQDRQ